MLNSQPYEGAEYKLYFKIFSLLKQAYMAFKSRLNNIDEVY